MTIRWIVCIAPERTEYWNESNWPATLRFPNVGELMRVDWIDPSGKSPLSLIRRTGTFRVMRVGFALDFQYDREALYEITLEPEPDAQA